MNTKIIAILMAGIVAMAMVVPMAMGGSEVTQEATVTKIATFDINNQANSAAIAKISFSGASGATDSAPTNDLDGAGSPQDLATDTPVAVIKNTGSANLKVHLTADGAADFKALVSEERAEVATTAAGTLSKTLTWGTQVDTGAIIAAGGNQNLFLQADLQGAGTAATGSLTVEGEA